MTETRLPLNPVDFMVLLILTEGESHGYALVQEMAERSGGRISLLPGNFYVVLRRLLRDELIAEADRKSEGTHRGRPRRYYEITEKGREAAAAEAARLRDLVDIVESSVLSEGSP